MSRRALPDAKRRVRGIPLADRPIDAVGHITAACANSAIRGVIVVMVDHRGNCDTRAFGEVRLTEMTWAGAVLQHYAMHEE